MYTFLASNVSKELICSYVVAWGISFLVSAVTAILLIWKTGSERTVNDIMYRLWFFGNVLLLVILIPIIYYIRNL